MHRCGGHHAKRVSLSKRHQDWAERLIQAGFVVLFRYNFRSRDLCEQCNTGLACVVSRGGESGVSARARDRWL
jgi:hypothetical protein